MQSKEELEKIVANTALSQSTRDRAAKILSNEFAGDEVAQKMIQLANLLQGTSAATSAASIDKSEVEDIVRDVIREDKIDFNDLDADLKSRIMALPQKIQMTIIQKGITTQQMTTLNDNAGRPIIQKMLSDVEARNNVYLYGGAGTGKTFSAEIIADILNYELVSINCNQFTSPLELIGGQTIDGYQEGKVICAWANLNPDGKTPMDKEGAVLLLDELPKIDPNTAGILNEMLAKVADYNDNGTPKAISNSRGIKFPRKNIFVIATGNTLLNSDSVDYEANFKQDLSLQDRFAGSTYQVFVDLENEWNGVLKKKWAFIFIYLNKVREVIKKEKFESKGFISIRIMKSAQRTYQVFRSIVDNPGKAQFTPQPEPATSFTPATNTQGNLDALASLTPDKVKTIEDTMNEFFELFTDAQKEKIKEDSDYDGFLRIVDEKNRIANLDMLNTESELEEVKRIIERSPNS